MERDKQIKEAMKGAYRESLTKKEKTYMRSSLDNYIQNNPPRSSKFVDSFKVSMKRFGRKIFDRREERRSKPQDTDTLNFS